MPCNGAGGFFCAVTVARFAFIPFLRAKRSNPVKKRGGGVVKSKDIACSYGSIHGLLRFARKDEREARRGSGEKQGYCVQLRFYAWIASLYSQRRKGKHGGGVAKCAFETASDMYV